MPIVTYIEHGGVSHAVDVEDGLSLMEGAVANGVPGIDGDCGGNCACATCHVYVDPAWADRTGVRTSMEAAMLEFAEGVTPESRLCCQITSSDVLNGVVVRLPVSQH